MVMKDKKEKKKSRKASVRVDFHAGEDACVRQGEKGVAAETESGRENRMPEGCGMFEGAALPGKAETGRNGFVFYLDEKPGVLEMFRRSVPEQELERRRRLPRVNAFGDFLQALAGFAGKSCLGGQEKCSGSGRLRAFRELEKLLALYQGENGQPGCVSPAGWVCVRRKGSVPGGGNPAVCEGIVIDLSDLFK